MNELKIVLDNSYKDVFKAQIERHDNSISYNNILQDSGKDYWLVASHSDKLINNRMYQPAELQKLGDTYTNPYPKPVLLHHNDDSEPVGRIVDSAYISANNWMQAQQLLGDTVELPIGATGALLLKAHIVDPQAIQKIEDGRYMTVSIGFAASMLKCSICGQDWVADGPCEHEFGQVYDGDLAFGVPENMQAMEISFVNVPADNYATVVTPNSKSTESMHEDAETYTFIKKRANKATVLFADSVNLALATCGVASHIKDHKESEEKGEMAEKENKATNSKATTVEAEDKVSMLSDSLINIKNALAQLIRMQIDNYDTISGKVTDGLDDSSDITSLMDGLSKAKQVADEFLKDECTECEEESDSKVQNTNEDNEGNAESDNDSTQEDMSADALKVVSNSFQQITDALSKLQKEFTDSFEKLASTLSTLTDKLDTDSLTDSKGENTEGEVEKAEEEHESDKTNNSNATDTSDTTVIKETNPAAAAAIDSEINKPRTLREIFSRTFGS